MSSIFGESLEKIREVFSKGVVRVFEESLAVSYYSSIVQEFYGENKMVFHNMLTQTVSFGIVWARNCVRLVFEFPKAEKRSNEQDTVLFLPSESEKQFGGDFEPRTDIEFEDDEAVLRFIMENTDEQRDDGNFAEGRIMSIISRFTELIFPGEIDYPPTGFSVVEEKDVWFCGENKDELASAVYITDHVSFETNMKKPRACGFDF